MIIPTDKLEEQTLVNLIEAFVMREGTDYGDYEVSLAQKVQQVHEQLRTGEVKLVFDASSESVNIMTAFQYQAWMMENT